MILPPRATVAADEYFVDPTTALNLGLWLLFAGATVLLALRLWVKIDGSHDLWHDDHILVASWLVLCVDNILICHEYATGYVDPRGSWDERMHILINTTSCLTLVGQAWSKTAFGVTLLRISTTWQRYVLWFCMVSMNAYMIVKVIFQWAKVCGKGGDFQASYRLDFCLDPTFRDRFKQGGQVYNIIMDFVFAFFPWVVAWRLNLRRREKLALCATLSLGAVVAITSAIRLQWRQNDGLPQGRWYYWTNAMGNIWFSSEIAGTIMMQCIPVLRPYLRDVRNSKARNSKGANGSWQGTTLSDTAKGSSKRESTAPAKAQGLQVGCVGGGGGGGGKPDNVIELVSVPEATEGAGWQSVEHAIRASHTAPLEAEEGIEDGGSVDSTGSDVNADRTSQVAARSSPSRPRWPWPAWSGWAI